MVWIWVGAGVLGLIILALAAAPLLGKLRELRRALGKLQRRQTEAEALQTGAQQLERTLLGLQERTETTQERLALLKSGHGESTGRHAKSPFLRG
jgi:hypothetical protein